MQKARGAPRRVRRSTNEHIPTQSPPPLPQSTPQPMWACQVCTLEQSDRRQTCAACLSVRPDAISTEYLEHLSSMSGFRNYKDLAKKFSSKKIRGRVDAMSNKPCPLHDQGRKRPCMQANNPLDICVHFQPNRSRCAPPPSVCLPPARTARRAFTPACSLAFADPRQRCTRRPCRYATMAWRVQTSWRAGPGALRWRPMALWPTLAPEQQRRPPLHRPTGTYW